MRELLPLALRELKAGRGVVLSVVVDSKGSTPRKRGSVMLAYEDGFQGTVGGGALEFECQKCAKAILIGEDTNISQTLGYSLSSDETGDICMICGGDVFVHFALLKSNPESISVFEAALRESDAQRDAWIALKISDNEPTKPLLFTESNLPDNTIDRSMFSHFAFDGRDETGLFIIPIGVAGRAIVFGGGHIGKALAPVLHSVGFGVVIYDDRPEYAVPEFFPEAEVICADFREIAKHITIGSGDYLIIVTRGHKNDYDVLHQTLPGPARYIGCIGSRRKIAIQRQRLHDDGGISETDIAKLINPIGVDIGAETPEEIAISIAAELIKVRAGGGKGYKKSGLSE